jgi:hypothetical protein
MKDAPTMQEIQSVLGVLCQELAPRAKYCSVIAQMGSYFIPIL